MGTVTYPDETVARFLEENFVAAKIDVTQEDPKTREACARFNQVWTPTFVVLEPQGREAWRAVGYFPPNEFLGALLLAMGMARMLNREYAEAHDLFREAAENHPDTAAAPEALYWQAVAAYRRDGKPDELLRIWRALKARHPESLWWTKASFIDG